MKVQKVINLCKESGALYITEHEGEQWVGNGQAVYPLFGLPKFTPETLCETFGLNEEQQGKMILNEKLVTDYGGINFGELDGNEIPAEEVKVAFTYAGAQLIAVKCNGGISFIKKKYLAPFDEDVQLWRRNTGSSEYFVVTGGMFIKGIVLPESSMRADIAAEIKEIAAAL